MPVPNTIDDLSTTESANSPQGTETAKGVIDNYFRRHASFIAQLRDQITALAASAIAFLQAGTGAVPRPVQSKERDVVSVFDFMSAAQIADALTGSPPTLDHTAAAQLAINYCVANDRDLEVPGLLRLTAPLNINRAVDGLPYYSYFTIRTGSGGGFYVDSAITMFSSSLFYVADPVSQLVRWQGIRFITSDADLATHVIDKKFLRVEFNQCNFERIKCLDADAYMQSVYLIGCNARRWAGTFFKVAPQGYDIQVIGGMYEASYGPGFDIASPIGAKIWTMLEGIQGTALKINGAQGIDISSYFEGNSLDIDCRTGGLENTGINLHGSYFSNGTATYTVKWGKATGCSSRGNWHTGNMHDLQSDSNVDINDVAQGTLSNTSEACSHVGYRQGATAALAIRGSGSASYTVSALVSTYTISGNRMQIDFSCTLTSTGTNSADQLYIPSAFPTIAAASGMLCGHVEVVGSATNNGISPLAITSAAPLRIQSSVPVIPANVAGATWPVRGQISYIIG